MPKFTNHAEMVAALAKPGEAIIQSLTPLKAHLWHMASCVMGEVAELFIATVHADIPNVKEELGDIEFYLEGIRAPLHILHAETVTTQPPPVDSAGLLVVKSGEMFDAIKKHVIYNKELDMKALVNSLRGIESCLAGIRDDAELNREETIQGNLDKLNVRYAEGKFSDQQAQARADKAGVA